MAPLMSNQRSLALPYSLYVDEQEGAACEACDVGCDGA